jgi:hypothetical protein
VHIAFGIYAGYPLPYSYAYPAPAYGYAAPPPAQPVYGGISFEIGPVDASIHVDGAYVGTVGQYYDPSRPLPLTPGRHRIELQAPGYVPLVFDVDVQPGQVIPYRGDLQPY